MDGLKFHNRRGSALLIVLGMLSFMVISAVAFSAYMRFARLPSSFLRRNVASRFLVKAALARAIDEIDAAIGNNPHPNVGTEQYYYPRNNASTRGTSYQWNRNHWKQRVYMGGTNDVNRVPMVGQSETVSPLCLEALAYLPPSIVNEVRYYSRHSQAATWHDMDYDAGRYAFCAVDVSDYFDINSLHADFPRLSSAGSRISLAYLFESENHDSATPVTGMCTPAQWDDFMSNFLPDSEDGRIDNTKVTDTKLPLTSLADFNLALKSLGAGSLKSPFCDYVENNKQNFYGFSESGPDAERIRRMTFVTDSFVAPTNSNDVLDLSDDAKQPFAISDLTGGTHDFYSIVNYTSQGAADTELDKFLCGLGKCQLFDYLDKDNIPLSLAIPTLERNPMICGIDIGIRSGTLKLTPTVTKQTSVDWGDGGAVYHGVCIAKSRKVSYRIEGLPNSDVQVVVTYPFRNRLTSNEEGEYKIEGRLAYFLVDSEREIGLRTYNLSDVLHLKSSSDDDPFVQKNEISMLNNSVLSVPLVGQSVDPSSFNPDLGQQGMVKMITLTQAAKFSNNNFFELEYDFETKDETPIPEGSKEGDSIPGSPKPIVSDDVKPDEKSKVTINKLQFSWMPLNNEGQLDSSKEKGIYNEENLKKQLASKGFIRKIKLNAVVWVWIKYKNKVVDMVPACVHDDINLNDLNNTEGLAIKWEDKKLGTAYPIMRFDLTSDKGSVIEIDSSKNIDGAQVMVGESASKLHSMPQSVYVGDPRFNHAPESWFYETETSTVSANDWLDKCGCKGDCKDGDIFMQISDQGYLQSYYELYNMLYLKNPYADEEIDNSSGLYDNPADYRVCFKKGSSSAKNHDRMWCTYDPFVLPNGATPGVDFSDTKFVSSRTGYRVNPYSETNTLVAAFANTPLEWRFAADSDRTDGKVQTVSDTYSDSSFNKKYAWNEYSTGNCKLYWEDITDFALGFRNAIRNNSKNDWRDVFDDLGWYNSTYRKNGDAYKYLTNNIQLEDDAQHYIYNCDRKFLYGFWRESLAVQQQLFLVFVRAEPQMMGGGMAGAIPPSLGARAVALVWRDPSPSKETSTGKPAPHRTRTLFYRQFD